MSQVPKEVMPPGRRHRVPRPLHDAGAQSLPLRRRHGEGGAHLRPLRAAGAELLAALGQKTNLVARMLTKN